MTPLHSAILFQAGAVTELKELMCLEDAEFVRAAGAALFDDGFNAEQQAVYTHLLRSGHSKLGVLDNLSKQFGDALKKGRLAGFRKKLFLYRISRLPIIGFAFGFALNIPSESCKQMRLRVIENQLYLLAKNIDELSVDHLELAPWGGVHRHTLLEHVFHLEKSLEPSVSVVLEELLSHARNVIEENGERK